MEKFKSGRKNVLSYLNISCLVKLLAVSKKTKKFVQNNLKGRVYQIEADFVDEDCIEKFKIIPQFYYKLKIKDPYIFDSSIIFGESSISELVKPVKELEFSGYLELNSYKNLYFFRNIVKLLIEYSENVALPIDFTNFQFLKELNLQGTELKIEAFESIKKLDLVKLDISLVKHTKQALDQICQIQSLDELSLRANYLQAKDTESLSKLTNLSKIDLQNNLVGQGDFSHLPREIKHLNLINNLMTSNSCHILSKMTNLLSLELGWNRLRDEACVHLSKLPKLRSLHLNDNNIGNKGLVCLASMNNLTELNLANNFLSTGSIEILSKMTNLTVLNLNSSYIDGSEWTLLSKMTNLIELNLDSTDAKDADVVHLLSLTKLLSLDLASCSLTGFALETLGKMPNLVELNVSFIDFSEEEINKFCSLSVQRLFISAEGLDEERIEERIRRIIA